MKFAFKCFKTAKEFIMIGVTVVGTLGILSYVRGVSIEFKEVNIIRFSGLKVNEIVVIIGYFIVLTILATIIDNFFENLKNKNLEDK